MLRTLLFRLFMLVLFSSLLLACSSKGKKKDPYQDMSAEVIYDKATVALNKKRYSKAVEAYESLDAQYPFGDYTEKAHLDIIYAYYRFNELPSAMRAADRYIRLHPRSPYLDYAYYMRGLIKSTESIGFAARYLPLDLSKRDTNGEQESFAYFQEFLSLYPNSQYAPDARQRLVAMRNDLAKQQLNIAEYYMTRSAYLAAANRAQVVVEQHPQTTSINKSLALMVVAYDKLQMDSLSEQAHKALVLNAGEEKAEELMGQIRKL
jgi:outer membrane protein assembly factor BamD